MSLDDVKLPFLRISDLPDKFAVCVSGWSEQETKYTRAAEKPPQKVLHVILIDENGQAPIAMSPADHFLNLSNHAMQEFRKKSIRHLDELKGKIVHFKKVDSSGFGKKTIEPTKIENW